MKPELKRREIRREVIKMRNKLLSGLNFERKEVKEMKKIMIVLFLLMVTLFLGASQAKATPVTIWTDGLWDWGTNYNLVGNQWQATNANPYYGTVSQPLTDGIVSPVVDGTEDSYGITRITAIFPTGGGDPLYDMVVDPYEVTAMFYGFDDVYRFFDMAHFSTITHSVGGHVSIYADFPKNYNPFNPPGAQSVANGGGRFDSDGMAPDLGDGFLTVTDGVLVLDLVPVLLPAMDMQGTPYAYTLESSFFYNTLYGSGGMLLNVTGNGIWDQFYDTNTFQYGADFKLDYSALPSGHPTWLVTGTADAQGDVIPEPSTILLLGGGLIGVGVFARRFRKK